MSKKETGIKEIGFKSTADEAFNIVHDKDYKQGYVENGAGVYTFDIMGSEKFAFNSIMPFFNNNRRLIPMKIGDFEFIPLGEFNKLPDEIAELLRDDNTTPGILEKKTGLIWGQGPELYRTKFVDKDKTGVKTRVKEFDTDPEIQAWLDTWDYKGYILKAINEYTHLNGHFTQYIRNKGPRIGKEGKINELKHIPSIRARLGWHDPLQAVPFIIVGDFERPWINGLTQFPIFDKITPFANPIAMNYSNMTAFATDGDYGKISFEGSITTIKMSNSVSKILLNFNLNSAVIKFHIESPELFWNNKKAQLEDKCQDEGTTYSDKMLDKYKDEYIQAIASSLSGIDMVGKLVHTVKMFDDESNQYVSFTITAIDQKIKDYFDAQISLSKHAALMKTAGLGLHPALTGLSIEGNLPSGSEQLYAFKFFLMTSTDIPEMIICRDINNAIQANFPGKDLKMGFYHDVIITEAQTSPNNRVINSGTGGNNK